jgi:hypothetical protein
MRWQEPASVSRMSSADFVHANGLGSFVPLTDPPADAAFELGDAAVG